MKVSVITWNEDHDTIVLWDARARRSRRLRWAVRAARRGDLEAAWRLMAGLPFVGATHHFTDGDGPPVAFEALP